MSPKRVPSNWSVTDKFEPKNPVTELAPAFIMGVASVRLGETRRFLMSIRHNREAFKPSHLYAHLTDPKAFILEKVQWGECAEEQIACPLDLNDFGMTQRGLVLALPRLGKGERVNMSVLYTGHSLRGLNNGDMFSLPIIWAEPGASLLHSQNVTMAYSVE